MENNKNLILQTINRVNNNLRECKVYQKIAALVLAGATVASLSSCEFLDQFINNPPTPGGTDIVTPGGGEQTNGYSDLLNSLLEDSAANTLINRAREDGRICSSAEFDPHPYAFLQKQGHNVNAIKNGELKCTTQTFVKDSEPNNLYMLTYVENDAATPYYTEYLLKYELTEKEMYDYNMLHEDLYAQTFLINNAISKAKTPTIVSKANITVQAHNGIRRGITEYLKSTNEQYVGTEYVDVMIKSFNTENQSFELYVFTSGSKSVTKSESSVCVYNCLAFPLKISDNIFTSPYNYMVNFALDPSSDIKVLDSVTTYHTQSIGFTMSSVENLKDLD